MNLNQTIEVARNVLRFKHMAIKTEKSYVHWIRRFACGGTLRVIGESYPESSNDWDEERDSQDGEWHRRY